MMKCQMVLMVSPGSRRTSCSCRSIVACIRVSRQCSRGVNNRRFRLMHREQRHRYMELQVLLKGASVGTAVVVSKVCLYNQAKPPLTKIMQQGRQRRPNLARVNLKHCARASQRN